MKKRKIIISLLLAASVGTAAMPVSAAGTEKNECGGVMVLPAGEDAGWEDDEDIGLEENVEDIDSEENVDDDENDWEDENGSDDEDEIDLNDDGTEDAEGNWEIEIDYDYSDAAPANVEPTECGVPAVDVEMGEEGTEDGGQAEEAVSLEESFAGDRTGSSSDAPGKAEYAASRDDAVAGIYANPEKIEIRSGAGDDKAVLAELEQDAKVHCYGYYTEKDGEKWLYVQYIHDGTIQTGFCSINSLK